MTENEVRQFFIDIHGDEHVNFNCIKKGVPARKINGHYNSHTINLLNQMNEQDYEIYFVVNAGGYKDEEICRINAVFCDFDCGKDENGNYFPLDVVAEYKKDKLSEIEAFQLKPSNIVDTRNGLHVYYLLHDGATREQFDECERRLIAYFNADPKVKNLARLLRVPATRWCKDPTNKYMTTIIQHNDVRYEIADIIDSLPEVVGEGDLGVSKRYECKNYISIMDTQSPTASTNKPVTNVTLIRRQEIEALQERLNPVPVKLSSHEEVYEHLKQQDLEQFLGRYGRMNCVMPNHDDANPSSGVIVNAKTGHHIYNCHSANCGVKGTIIQITERLTGLERIDALRFLRKVYRIEYVETEWQKRQREILAENKRLLINDEFQDIYSDVYARMRSYTSILSLLHELAIKHVTTETFTDSRGYPVFYTSISWVANACDTDARRVTDRIALLAYLGLINKLPEHEIPEAMLKRAKGYARRTGRRRIAFYSIPPYGEKTLSFSRKKAQEFKESGLTMKGWGRELLLRKFGEAEADRVYPQEKGKPLTELSQETTNEITQSLLSLLEIKGWTTEREILDCVVLKFKGQNQFKERQVKRVLPELMDAYALTTKRLNLTLKKLLSIESKGYFNIICQEDWLSKLEIETVSVKENGQFPTNRPELL